MLYVLHIINKAREGKDDVYSITNLSLVYGR